MLQNEPKQHQPSRPALVALLVIGVAGCAAPQSGEDVEAIAAPLFRDGAVFPGRSVRVCWENQVTGTMSRPDFATFSPIVHAAAVNAWSQATGLRLYDWGACPTDDRGMIKVGLNSGSGSSTAIDGYTPNGGTFMTLDVSDDRIKTNSMHEFGHALGFAHDMNRPNYHPEPNCPAQATESGDDEDTPEDHQSIMSYCNPYARLSAWDITGAQNAYGHPNYFADVNGDGRADALVVNSDGVYVRLSSGTSFNPTAFNWTNGAYYGQKGTHFADVTGDGKADAIVVNDYGIVVRPSNGSGFPISGQAGWTEVAYYGDRGTFFADVTGDGKADAIAVNPDGIYVRNSNGSSFPASSQRFWTSTFFGELGTYFADVNGDHRADAIAVNLDHVLVRLSQGNAFGPSQTWTEIGYYGDFGTFFADVTGDGRADAIVVNQAHITVRRSNGAGFQSNEDWTGTFWGERGTMFADASGDGMADAIAVQEPGVIVRRSRGTYFEAAQYWTASAYYSLH